MAVELEIITAKAIMKTLKALPQNRRIRVLTTRLADAIQRARNDAHARRVADVRARFQGDYK